MPPQQLENSVRILTLLCSTALSTKARNGRLKDGSIPAAHGPTSNFEHASFALFILLVSLLHLEH